MAGFVQIIEFTTSRIDEMSALHQEFLARFPEPGPARIVRCADRDQAGTYLVIAEFPSYEAAMANSEHPVTTEFAGRMAALADGPPTFRNLDVLDMIIPDQAVPAQSTGATPTTV